MFRRVFALRIASILIAALLFSVTVAAQKAAPMRSVTIVSEPGAVVWIDGVRYGRTKADGRLEIKSVAAGPHTVRLRKDGFKERSQTLTAAHKGDLKVTLVETTDEAELAFQEAERLSLEDRQKAVDAYRRAVKLRPGYADAYLNMARVLSDAGELEEALEAIKAAKRARPAFAEASAVEGRIHKDSGDEAKAIAAFKRAISEGKGIQAEAYTGLGLLYKEKAEGFSGTGDFDNEKLNYDLAAQNLKIALKQLSGAPDALVIYQLLGLIYERQKRYDEAIALYEEFLRLFPDSNEATAIRSFIVQIKKDQASQ